MPELDRQRKLLALAEPKSRLPSWGHEEDFAELWRRVERLLTSYCDKYVSDAYGRELSRARASRSTWSAPATIRRNVSPHG